MAATLSARMSPPALSVAIIWLTWLSWTLSVSGSGLAAPAGISLFTVCGTLTRVTGVLAPTPLIPLMLHHHWLGDSFSRPATPSPGALDPRDRWFWYRRVTSGSMNRTKPYHLASK